MALPQSAFVCIKEKEVEQMLDRSLIRSFGCACSGISRFVTAVSVAQLNNDEYIKVPASLAEPNMQFSSRNFLESLYPPQVAAYC